MKKLIAAALLLICSVGTAMAQIPSVTLRTLDGKTIDTAKLNNDGKPFVISFFASWCKPCNRELDNVAEVYDEWKEETGMKFFAVSIDEGQNAQKVKPFVDNHGWEYDVLLDPNSDFRRALGVPMIPHTFVFDGQGKQVMSHNGYKEGDEQEVIEKIREILAAAPAAEAPACDKAEGQCCKKAEGECQKACDKAEGKCCKTEGKCCKDGEKCCDKPECCCNGGDTPCCKDGKADCCKAEGDCCQAKGEGQCCKK